jgi:hypothetical protein
MGAAIDAADAAFVERPGGYVAILLARANQMPADAAFLRKRLRTAPRAFKRPRALYAQIVDITASVADACEKKSSSSDPEILSQLDRISDPEEQSRFYSKTPRRDS